VCLAGCSGLFKSTAPPEQIYFLRAPAAGAGTSATGSTSPAGSTSAADGTAVGASVRVGHPMAGPGLDTPRIMLVQADHRMNFFAGSRWPAATPDLIGALTVQTLRGSGVWTSVEDTSSPFPSNYLLQIAVRRFEADYAAGTEAPEVHVVLDCIVGRREGRDVIATFVAAGSAQAAANRLGEVVSAFEQATGVALQALSQQTAQAVRRDVQRATQNADAPAPSSKR
jgi:ABC-type uncharacterized transport system auxiliary subunit